MKVMLGPARRTFSWRNSLKLACVALGGLGTIGTLTGACYEPSDTFPNWSFNTVTHSSSSTGTGGAGGMGGIGGMGGMGGSGGSVAELDCSTTSPLDNRTYFVECVLGNPQKNLAPGGGMKSDGVEGNCVSGNCHLSGNINFLALDGIEYETISAFLSESTGKGFIVKNPLTKSRLITYPGLLDHAGGRKWKPEDPKDPLYQLYVNTLTWLEREALNVKEETVIETEIVNPKGPSDTENPTPEGFVYLPLDYVADQTGDVKLVGAAISFFSVAHSDSLLELSDIKVWPAPGVGIEIKDMGIKVIPPPSSQKPASLNTQLYGDAVKFVAPKNVIYGSGQILLTNWQKGGSMFIQFKSIRSLLADKFGNAFEPCLDSGAFAAAVKKLPYDKFNCDKPNGLAYCGRMCHGGSDYSVDTTKLSTKMNLYPILSASQDIELACAIARPYITPGAPATSILVGLPDPAVPGNLADKKTHAFFKFCGSTTSHATFKNTMSPWICAESATSLCGSKCVDTKTSLTNCGSCGTTCNGMANEVCSDGLCTCAQGAKVCSNVCLDVQKDVNNCGECGKVCGGQLICSAGVCK